jgi:drug/metabolite transporter (DMT)-like permease
VTASPACGPVAVTPRDRSRGMAAAVLAVVVWGMGSVIVKLVDTGALVFAFYRLWLAVAFLATILLVTRRRLTWTGLRTSGLGGMLFGLHIVLFFSAVQRTSVADVTLIGALQPILLLAVSPWIGEQITARHAAWTAVAVAGVAVVIVGLAGSPVWSLTGDVLAVGSVMTFTGYFLASKRAEPPWARLSTSPASSSWPQLSSLL